MPLDLVSNTDEKVPILVNPVKANGKPAKLDGRAVVTIVSGNATATQATAEEQAAHETATGEKGLAGFVVSEDAAGQSEWKVEGDADLGTGVTPITEGGVYFYSETPAVSVGASGGSAVAK